MNEVNHSSKPKVVRKIPMGLTYASERMLLTPSYSDSIVDMMSPVGICRRVLEGTCLAKFHRRSVSMKQEGEAGRAGEE